MIVASHDLAAATRSRVRTARPTPLHAPLPAGRRPANGHIIRAEVTRMCDDGMFRDFPDIRWVVAHAGGAVPYLMERSGRSSAGRPFVS